MNIKTTLYLSQYMELLADNWVLTKLNTFVIKLNPHNNPMKMFYYCPMLSGSEIFNNLPKVMYI